MPPEPALIFMNAELAYDVIAVVAKVSALVPGPWMISKPRCANASYFS